MFTMSTERAWFVGMPLFSAWSVVIGALMFLGAATRPSAATAELTLMADGQPKALIVLPRKDVAPSIEPAAAKILADHLFQMSGARLPVAREDELGDVKVEEGHLVPEPGKVAEGVEAFVLVGEGDVAKRLGMTSQGLGPGGVLMKTGGNVLALLGPRSPSDPFGTRHAVICFLEQSGCRYLWPGELGKVVPKQASVTVGALEFRYTPKIGQRHIRFQSLSSRAEIGLERLQLTKEQWTEARKKAMTTESEISWGYWHRLGGRLGIHGGHAGAGLKGGWEKHGKEHPDWFAFQPDGTRDQSKAGERFRLCMSNQGLIACVAESIVGQVNENPNVVSVSLSPNDGGYSNFCMCEDCKQLDPPEAPKISMLLFDKVGESKRKQIEYVSLTDRMVSYWNGVANRVTKVHPNVLFVVDAYSCYSHPPVREKLHPNLVVRYVPSTADGWEGWQKAGAKRIFWRPNILLANRRNGLPHVMVQRLADTMSFMADNGTLATDFDSVIHNWAVHGLNYYAAARLNWNPYLTAQEILDDYCQSGFSEGAGGVKRYFLKIQEIAGDEEKTYAPEVIQQLRRFLKEADRAAGNDETIRSRIAFLRIGLNVTDLHMTLNRMVDQAKEKDPALDLDRAQRLLALNYFMLRDIVRNHHLAVNASYLVWGNGDFAAWSPIKGRSFRPEKESLVRVEAAKHTLTGKEDSIAETLAAFGLDR